MCLGWTRQTLYIVDIFIIFMKEYIESIYLIRGNEIFDI